MAANGIKGAETLMKTLACVLFAAALTSPALAQSKPGDFEVKPLPPHEKPGLMRMRAAGRMSLTDNIRPCGTNVCSTAQPGTCIEITNPETSWRTCISNQGRRGLVLGPTDLRRNPGGPWIRILREAGVAELFVPYHAMNLRLYDHETTSSLSIREVTPADAGPMGTVLTLSGQTRPQVVAEINDRGIAWLCKESRSISRRGQELVLWGVQDAANYDFIIEYRLRDDGSIGFRLGATGYNNPFFPPRSTTEAHMHDVLWRIDVDLNGSSDDTAVQLTHMETAASPLMTVDEEAPFNGGREGTARWNPETFFTLGVEDSSVNSYGHRIGYVLRPSAAGIARHFGEAAGLRRKERFTQSDFAVTTYKQTERDALFDSAHLRYLQPDEYLLGEGSFADMGVSDNESVQNTDVVLWYRSAAHHDPHDEDHAQGDPDGLMTGITNVHWQGVDLEPHNFFDFNPLGAPSRVQCQ
jgi:Cu2+-containing amine oxidase